MEYDISINPERESTRQAFMTGVYGWMVAALSLSGVSAWFVANSVPLQRIIFGNTFVFFGLIIGELALVWWLSASIRKISASAAVTAFLAYSLLNGATLASVFLVYTGQSVVQIFGVTALTFGAMSLYGMKAKSDLRSMGRYLSMAVIGIVIAIAVNMFLRSSAFDILISIVTVVVFTGLTAWDTQKLMLLADRADGSDTYKKVAIIGALELYLDFINIFLALIRLFGKRN
ncbi:Bax inhibitor-1/YccA family protein [Treponema zuelzerae]|uniref:Bax inhibitor-1/YccA family protein n=1 Tax=Teretinema zuelzerae TaxID=156 RepID=A0AAE3EI76_9SPIR|nr:Bax inhibitor-1/YccA family protein [Teretinema zuelzerae]MBN2812153.1 Bax inhibitor-1/YccA family protein [Spirochaetales bacterium]MCD1654038.1 Bax inhibitor-1/YccA family protein [Teretinema zuelzerae]HQL33672.1 Bax inhibitor-1/YccA family protein [Treponemataceae bacterium]